MAKNLNKYIGKVGENISSNFLIENEYEILERNFMCKAGEIDIIAKKNEEYIFCEVKTRKNLNFGRPVEAVSYHKLKHILKVAQYYLYINHLNNKNIRFDVIEVYINKDKVYINHIKSIDIL